MPIAAVIKGQTYAIHSDHLNTPRKLTQADGQAAWQWEYSAFGDEPPTTAAKRFTSETTTPTTGATSVPEVTFNLRYPGQYFDAETKLHYNYFRSYNSRMGRYTQFDPIGLAGGWNRGIYANGNALTYSDSRGLLPPVVVGMLVAGELTLLIDSIANGPAPLPVGGRLLSTGLANAAKNYSVLFEAPAVGLTRPVHRATANACLARELEKDVAFSVGMNQELGSDVLQHMHAGSSLKNPPGTVWHDPVDNASTVQLLRQSDHTNPALQPLLHPEGIGGFGTFYGK